MTIVSMLAEFVAKYSNLDSTLPVSTLDLEVRERDCLVRFWLKYPWVLQVELIWVCVSTPDHADEPRNFAHIFSDV
jgi:hypothetical protein